MMTEEESEHDSETLTEEEVEVTHPQLYRVILLNDDYSTMDFVVSVLETIFQKSPAEATKIMLQVHHKGSGVCGFFPKQIAEAKVDLVHKRAQSAGFPLRCCMEPADG